MIERGDWQVSQIARNAFDLEGKVVGTIGAGRIGYRVLQRLVPFNCKELIYYDYAPLPEAAAKAVNARKVEDLKDFVSQCDVVTVNCPLHEGTRNLINADLLKHFKKGAWLVNTARGAICDKDAVAEALKTGQLRGYAGDVWNVQPAPKDHVWRTMKNPLNGGNGMVPHYSGTTLDAQARYAAGVKSILENYFENKPQEPGNIIVGLGKYETKACECRTLCCIWSSADATQQTDNAERYLILQFTLEYLSAHVFLRIPTQMSIVLIQLVITGTKRQTARSIKVS